MSLGELGRDIELGFILVREEIEKYVECKQESREFQHYCRLILKFLFLARCTSQKIIGFDDSLSSEQSEMY